MICSSEDDSLIFAVFGTFGDRMIAIETPIGVTAPSVDTSGDGTPEMIKSVQD